ncbi:MULTISPECIES: bifunctional 2-C-methyl-D-erythritol 4-phosphate cytidylyltransferase/2-C-methyl-D-erythritol 2,4-cyclodiphosphate synthase [Hyphobacterium]|uniref:Bifunctional enzyme IspD/IspF n=1 Tax=Hyphobacterium vulgare TaxID=1736751 RepID=A0ABV6ZT26_9PROT
MPRTAAIIVAAGRGERAGGGIPKQYRMLGGVAVLRRTAEVLDRHPGVDSLVVVINPDDARLAHEALGDIEAVLVPGGATRTASVRAGLAALPGNAELVLIHDAARPFVSAALIDRVIDALARCESALPVLPVSDALWRGSEGLAETAIDRSGLFRAQTPQGFRLDALLAAYDRLPDDTAMADDAEVARAAGLSVATVAGAEENFKLTLASDFERAEQILTSGDCVTGSGFDVHRLEPADHMMLCGVRVEEGLGLVGHSDADAGLHAITDALLGAIAAGDIGQHFPPSDPQWRGASSDRFLQHAAGLARSAGADIRHVDVTLICERPKVSKYRDAMRARIADILDIPLARVSVKATTTEGLGFTGRREGLAAQASVTVRRGIGTLPAPSLRELANEVLERARNAGVKIATAESCTGGLIAASLTEIAGSSDVVDRGFVTYSNDAKNEMLSVPSELYGNGGPGAVSEDVARAMASGVLKNSKAKFAVAVTGVAGPGASENKPEGLVWFALAGPEGVMAYKKEFGALGRSQVRTETVRFALQLLRDAVG